MIKSTYLKGTSSLFPSLEYKSGDGNNTKSESMSVAALKNKVFENSKEPLSSQQGNQKVKRIRVFSNSARSKTIVLDGNLVLHFDKEGHAIMPLHLLPVLQKEMSVRPGRYVIMDDLPAITKGKPILGEETLLKEEVKTLLSALKDIRRQKLEEIASEKEIINTEESEKIVVKKGPGRPKTRRKE